jgi:hypothetical protein
MLSDYEVVRAAAAMMHQLGEFAEHQAAKTAAVMLRESHRAGLLIWERIWRQIAEMHPAQTGLFN